MNRGVGRRPVPDVNRERDYGLQVEAWLKRVFPEFGAHPAAIVAVIRLHHTVGKGRLTKREHGEQIAGAVRVWEARYGKREDC